MAAAAARLPLPLAGLGQVAPASAVQVQAVTVVPVGKVVVTAGLSAAVPAALPMASV